MKKLLIYDLPTRIFHWFFAVSFVVAFAIAKFIDDESPYYAYHMLIGLSMAGLVLFRLIWGIMGSNYAKFNSLLLSPSSVVSYVKEILSGSKKRYGGHNPASSWVLILMIIFTLGLASTGLMMANDFYKETVEEVHEFLAHAFLITAILHIAGIALHTIRHKDLIGLSMITGEKELAGQDTSLPINNSRKMAGLVLIIYILSVGGYLLKSYDHSTQTLHIFGKSLMLGEKEDGENEGATSASGKENEHDDDHDDD